MWVGCAASGSELSIVENQQPQPDCELSQSRTGEPIAEGTFDLAIGDRDSYVLTPLVRNRSDTDLEIVAAVVRAYEGSEPLTFACTEGSCSSWNLSLCDRGECPRVLAHDTASFEVPALSRVVSGYFLGQMDAAVLEGRRPPEFDVVAEVTLIRSDLVASKPFRFPIHLCLGCLVTFSDTSDSATRPGMDCCGFDRADDDGCYPGQDHGYSCRRCYQTVPEICNYGWLTCD